MTTRRQHIIDLLKKFGPKTNKELSEMTGLGTSNVSTVTTQLFKAGKLVREEAGKTLSNITVYRYRVVQENVPSRQENVVEAPANPRKPRTVKANNPANDIERIVGELAGAIVGAVVRQIIFRLPSELEALKPAALPAPPDFGAVMKGIMDKAQAPKPIQKVGLPKVGVVGLLPVQAGEIAAEFSDCLDITFWNDDQPLSTLRAMGVSCEVVFLHTRHARHAHDENLKAVGANVRRITGGTSNLKTALTEYFVTR